ncbi:hypothetical protein Tco_1271859 [Tanacetum coccineum]
MLLVTQIDTFYNGLTLSHRDTINTPEECYELIENMTAHQNHWDTPANRDETSRNISSTTTTESLKVVRQLEMMNKNFVEMMRQIQTIKSVDKKCETCGGPHSFTECPNRPPDGIHSSEAAYATLGNHNLGAITTRSGVAYDGPTILPTPSPLPKEVERETEVTKDKVQNTSLGSTAHVQPPVVQDPIPGPEVAPKPKPNCQYLILRGLTTKSSNFRSLEELRPAWTLELADFLRSVAHQRKVSPMMYLWKVGKFYFPADFIIVDYDVDPRVPLILRRPFLRMSRALIDVYGEELPLRVDDEAITFKVGKTLRYSHNYETVNQVNVIDVACEEYAQEVLRFSDSLTSGNPTPSDSIIASSSPSFIPFEGGDFILEEIETFLRTLEELSNLDDDYYDTEGDFYNLRNC